MPRKRTTLEFEFPFLGTVFNGDITFRAKAEIEVEGTIDGRHRDPKIEVDRVVRVISSEVVAESMAHREVERLAHLEKRGRTDDTAAPMTTER